MPFFADPEVVYGRRCLKSTQVPIRGFFRKSKINTVVHDNSYESL